MSLSVATRVTRARGAGCAKFVVFLSGLALLGACGQSAGGESASPTMSNCSATACTVSYPAKARNNQDSSGGPGITVLGVDTQLETIGQGAALFRVGTTSLNLTEGQSATQAGLGVKLTSLTPSQAVVTFTKA